MSFSRNYIFALCLAVIPIAGCSFQKPGEDAPGAAPASSWFLAPTQVVSSENTLSNPVWAMPTERTYRLRACVKDTVTSNPRIGEQVILSGEQQPKSLTLDSDGCFYWAESIPYQFLSDETFGEKLRTVELAGEKKTLRLAFNPWRDGAAGLVDLGHSSEASVKKLARAETSATAFRATPTLTEDTSNLVVSSMDASWMAPTESESGVIQAATFRMAVGAEQQTFDGKKTISLTRGDLRFKAVLLESKAGAEPKVLAVLEKPAETSLEQGWLQVGARFLLKEKPDLAAEKILFFELVPAETSAGIAPLRRQFVLGGASKLPEKLAAGDFSRAEQAAKSTPIAILGAAPKPTKPSLLSIVRYKASSPAAATVALNWQATHLVEFEVCLEPSLSLYPQAKSQLEGHEFEVRWTRNEAPTPFRPARNRNGCLKWTQKLQYPFAGVENYWPGTIEVKSEKAPFQSFHANIAYDINPWREKEVGWDREDLGKAPPNEDPSPPSLELDNYTATYLGTWSHLVDKYLQLTLLRKVLFQISPKLNRPYSFDHGHSWKETLREHLELDVSVTFSRADGKGVTEGLEKLASDPAFMGRFETTAAMSKAGNVNAYGAVPIAFVNLLHWAARVEGVMTVKATHALQPPGSAVKVGLFNGAPLRNDQDGKSLIDPEPASGLNHSVVREPHPEVQKKKLDYPVGSTHPLGSAYYVEHPWTESPIEMFTKYLGKYSRVKAFEEVEDIGEPDSLDLEAARASAKQLCPSSAADCQRQPLKYFQVGAVKIAEEVKPEADVEDVLHGITKLSATFFNERKFSESEIKGHTFRESFQAGINGRGGYDKYGRGIIPLASFTIDNQNYTTEEGLFTQDWRNGIRGSSDIHLERKTLKMRIQGKFRNCFVIRPLPSAVSNWGRGVETRCSAAKESSIVESYYALADQAVHYVSPLIDTGDFVQRGWQKTIRGEDAFLAFDKLLTDATRGFLLKKIESFHDGIETTLQGAMQDPLATNRYFQDGGIFPGVADYREYSDIFWTDFEIRREIDSAINDMIQGKVRPAVAARYQYCLGTELATMVPHREFKANNRSAKEWEEKLLATGAEARCKAYAKDPQWDKLDGGKTL